MNPIHFAAFAANALDRLVDTGAIEIAHDDDGAFLRKLEGGRLPDAAARAGDDRYFVCQPHGYPFRLILFCKSPQCSRIASRRQRACAALRQPRRLAKNSRNSVPQASASTPPRTRV